MRVELSHEVAHVLLQMVVKSLMRKPQVLMLDEMVKSTLQKGTTVDRWESRVHWQVGPTQIVEVNIDDINDNNDYMIDSISGDLKEEIIETDTTERLAQEDYKELMAPPEKDMDQLKEPQTFHKEVPDAWSEEDTEKKKDIEQLEVRHQEKLKKFEKKLKQIHALKSKSISPGEAWILCREESSILAQFHQRAWRRHVNNLCMAASCKLHDEEGM